MHSNIIVFIIVITNEKNIEKSWYFPKKQMCIEKKKPRLLNGIT